MLHSSALIIVPLCKKSSSRIFGMIEVLPMQTINACIHVVIVVVLMHVLEIHFDELWISYNQSSTRWRCHILECVMKSEQSRVKINKQTTVIRLGSLM
jgi:hypothetical protein